MGGGAIWRELKLFKSVFNWSAKHFIDIGLFDTGPVSQYKYMGLKRTVAANFSKTILLYIGFYDE